MLEPGTLRRQNKAAKAKSDALKELRYHLVLVSKSNATNRNELLAGLVTEFSGAVDDDTIRTWMSAEARERIEVNELIVSTFSRRFSVTKQCRTAEERSNAYIAAAHIVPRRAVFGDTSGNAKRVAARLGINRTSKIFRRAQMRGDAFDDAEGKGPLSIGDAVTCRYGRGVLSALQPDGACTVRLAHGPVDFKSMGKDKGGGQVRRQPISLLPPQRETRGDTISPEVVEDIAKYLEARCPTSPCKRDKIRQQLGPRQWEERRKMFRYETWDALWVGFPQEYRGSAAKLLESVGDANKHRCPWQFCKHAPWNLVKGTTSSCRCGTCENHEKHCLACKDSAKILETIAEADEDDDAEEEETDRNDMSEKLKELQHVLSAERKYEACLRVTCGACGPDASLLHRNEACINGQCASCGFARLWSNGVRRSLVEAETDTAADETADDDDDDGVALDVVALELDGAVLRNELHESWRTKITWKTYAHQQKEHDPTADRVRDGDREASSNGTKKNTELVVVSRSGTLVDFLDAYEKILTKSIPHRYNLDVSRRADVEGERIRRPGVIRRDMDYGENGNIEEAILIQSEHWTSKQFTLFGSVASWFERAEWNKTDGQLKPDQEVTVNGELMGERFNESSYWARVVRPCGVDRYEVEDSNGNKTEHRRADLRRRVKKQVAFVGITGDKKHDSYSMRYFTKQEFDWFVESETLTSETINTIITHSDNAGQHFKSSVSLHYYTTLKELFPGITFIWAFGTPGHGKGEWDGLFGMLKQWLRTRQLEALTNPGVILTDTKRLASPFDIYQQLFRHFDSRHNPEWSEHAKLAGKKLTLMNVFWAAPDAIVRPDTKEEFETITGIRSPGLFEFKVLGRGRLAARRLVCNCSKCYVWKRSVETGGVDAPVAVTGCARGAQNPATYGWRQYSCAQKDTASVARTRARAQQDGHALAKALKPGTWIAVACRDDPGPDEFWLGMTVAAPQYFRSSKCFKVFGEGERVADGQIGDVRLDWHVRFDPGDIAVAVQWYERRDDDPARREFEMGTPVVDLFNSTELRLVLDHGAQGVEKISGPAPSRARSAAARAAKEAELEPRRCYRISPEVEAAILAQI